MTINFEYEKDQVIERVIKGKFKGAKVISEGHTRATIGKKTNTKYVVNIKISEYYDWHPNCLRELADAFEQVARTLENESF
jgi:hypothetical protein|tara:strand:- start:1263 stop:1505 length:243 start_codon:yes stop_codon:yes gene_type:complete